MSARLKNTLSPVLGNIWKILTILIVLGVGLARTITIPEADTFWQIRSGLDLWQDWNFYRPDEYSWTSAGKEYISNSWLWNILLAGVYSLSGVLGVAIFTGLCSVILLGLLALLLRSFELRWAYVFFTVSIGSVFLMEWLTARPQMMDYILLVLGMYIIQRLAKRNTPLPSLFLMLGFVTLVWQNFHLTGPVGAVSFAGFYFMVLMEGQTRKHAREVFAKIGFASALLVFLLLVCLATPYGLDGVFKPFITVSASSGLIAEWISPWDFTEPSNNASALCLALLLIAILALALQRQWLPVVFVGGLVLVASDQARWVPFAVILSSVYVCRMFSMAFTGKDSKLVPYLKAVGLGVVMAILAAGSLTFLSGSRVAGNYGYELMPYLPSDCKLYNEQAFGGPAILLREDVKVSLDGRNDLYGVGEYLDHVVVASGGSEALDWLNENGITCALVHPGRGLNETLENSPDWFVEAEDHNGARLWVR